MGRSVWFSTVCLISAPRIIRQPRCLFHMQHMTSSRFSISGLCKCGGIRCNYPRRKPRPLNKTASRLVTAGPDSYDPSHAFVGASLDSVTCRRLARPVPLGNPLPGVGQRHSGTLGTNPTIRVHPLMGCYVSFHQTMGMHEWGRVPEGDIATARPTRLSHHDKTTADSVPTRLALFIGRGGGRHNLVRGCAMVAVDA